MTRNTYRFKMPELLNTTPDHRIRCSLFSYQVNQYDTLLKKMNRFPAVKRSLTTLLDDVMFDTEYVTFLWKEKLAEQKKRKKE